MRNLKKILALVLALVMTVSLVTVASAATTATERYNDHSSITARYVDAVETLTGLGIFQGDSGNFKPQKAITRAEASKIIYRLMTSDTKETQAEANANYAKVFTDLSGYDWAKGTIGFAYNSGYMIGTTPTKFSPKSSFTGYQVLAVMLRALGYDPNNEEFVGANWEEPVSRYTAERGLLAGVSANDTKNLSGPMNREAVAQVLYNTAFLASTVVPGDSTNPGHYTATGKHLMTLSSSNPDPDKWGVGGTGGSGTWNNVDQGTVNDFSFTDDYVYQFYIPMTECDVYNQIKSSVTGFSGTPAKKNFTTYTNGKGNVGSQVIEAADTTNYIGHQGRWTRIYQDRIVYIDTYLGVVNSFTPAVYDHNNHLIDSASINVSVYSNNLANGAKKITKDVDVTDTYAAGDIFSCNVETTTPNNVLTSTVKISNVKKLTPTPVTVQGVQYSSDNASFNTNTPTWNRGLVSFTGTNGVTYKYNYTFGYNTADGTNAPLTNNAIGKTYNVYTDANGNVLGLTPISTAIGYGVAIAVDTVKISTGKFVIEYTILLPDGTTTKLQGVNWTSSTDYYGSEVTADGDASAMANGWSQALLQFVPMSNGFYRFYRADSAAAGNVKQGADTSKNALYAGDADGITGTLINDDTVIYVVDYIGNNAVGIVNQTYDVDSAKGVQGVEIKNGFKSINDLFIKSGTIDGTNRSNLNITWYDKDKDGYADYVLVRGANLPASNRKENTLTYALLAGDPVFDYTVGSYHYYDAFVNGVKTQIQVGNAADVALKTGLYSCYNWMVGDIYQSITRLVGTGGRITANIENGNDATKLAHDKFSHSIGKGSYSYASGVLTVSRNIYLTVADGAQVYRVDPTNNAIYTGSLDDLNTAYYGDKCDLWFELDEYGYIDVIYIIENTDYNVAKLITNINVISGGGMRNGGKVSEVKFTLQTSINGGTALTASPVASVSVVWQKQNAAGGYDTWTGSTFTEGTYRAVVTISADANYYINSSTGVYLNPANGLKADVDGISKANGVVTFTTVPYIV